MKPSLTAVGIDTLASQLDIGKWEMSRTHWAIKDVDLARVLVSRGIHIPVRADSSRSVDISTHQFKVAMSFPGEVRLLVEPVVHNLERLLGKNSCFYDNYYVSQLARPSLDTLLQDIYRNRSKLIVVYLCSDYQRKEWCGVEFRAIKEIMMERDHGRIMLIRTDDGAVDGVFKTDGYVDGRKFSASEIAEFIRQRVVLRS